MKIKKSIDFCKTIVYNIYIRLINLKFVGKLQERRYYERRYDK
nr:MAG TPA: hypothetical protein [Caudoviricetes sp.]